MVNEIVCIATIAQQNSSLYTLQYFKSVLIRNLLSNRVGEVVMVVNVL